MITSFFNKSKPINYIIVFFITAVAFITARTGFFENTLTLSFFFKQLVVFAICIITILLLDFIITKNNLTKSNNYEVLLFSLFLLTLVQTTNNTHILISNFFVLLALRRIMSLSSQKSIKSKLFDAALWIAVASVLYFWAILFFVAVILSLILYTDNNIRHWIMPFLGVGTVLIIAMSISIVLYGDYFEISKESQSISYDFSPYNSVKFLVAITMLLSFGIWSSIFYLQNIKKKKKASRVSFKMVIIVAVIAFVLVLQAPKKNGSEFLFLFGPLAIIVTNYMEIIEEKWFKEVFIAALVLLPFVVLML